MRLTAQVVAFLSEPKVLLMGSHAWGSNKILGCSALGQIVILGSGCGLVQVRILSFIHDTQPKQSFEGLKLSLRDPRYSGLL